LCAHYTVVEQSRAFIFDILVLTAPKHKSSREMMGLSRGDTRRRVVDPFPEHLFAPPATATKQFDVFLGEAFPCFLNVSFYVIV
jgi:hypothetical protein